MTTKLIFILFTALHLQVSKQHPAPPAENSVESTQIVVLSQTGKFSKLGTPAQLEKAFGKAKVKKEANEMEGGFGYSYLYKGLEVYYYNNRCENISVTGPAYRVTLNGVAYRVGDNIIKLKNTFPVSYRNRKDSGIFLGITYRHSNMDAFVFFKYNQQGIITQIEIGEDNS